MSAIKSNVSAPNFQASRVDFALWCASTIGPVFRCIRNGKQPEKEGWQQDATTDEATIRKWFDRPNPPNIGIATGGASRVIVVDLDRKDGKDGGKALAALAEARGTTLAGTKTLTVATPSGGLHLFYRVPADVAAMTGNVSALGEGIDIRAAGNLVVGAGSKIDGKPYCVHNGGTVPIADMPQWLVDAFVASKAKAEPRKAPEALELDTQAAMAAALAYLADAPASIQGHGGNDNAYKVAAHVKDLGLSEAACLDAMDLDGGWNSRCVPPWDRDELADGPIKNAYRYGQNAPGSSSIEADFGDLDLRTNAEIFADIFDEAANDNDEAFIDAALAEVSKPPVITFDEGNVPEIAHKAESALIAAGAPFYDYAGGLVRPVTEIAPASGGRRTVTTRLSPVSTINMIDHMARAATWKKPDARSAKKVRRTTPPKLIADMVLGRSGEWRFPKLAGIITAPTLRPDGSVLDREGYDAATGLLLASPPAMQPIPEHPTRAAALAALDMLDDLLDEFPFADAASRSVALSMLITPVVRGSMAVAPMHIARAPAPGTGKSYMIDLANGIACGDRAPVISAAHDGAELEKRLSAVLIAGQPIISIDNVNGTLGGDFLCQAVERPRVQPRVLGESRTVTITNSATIYATGNNLTVTDDLVRRAIVCTLDADMERPETRKFKADPFNAVAEDRGRFIAAALTIVRAYQEAGHPRQLPSLASFEDWSRNVRSALVWLGKADPVETMATAYQEDPNSAARRAIVAAWREVVEPGRFVSARQLIDTANGDIDIGVEAKEELKRALLAVAADPRGRDISVERFGKWLRGNNGRIVDGYKIASVFSGKAKTQTWGLQSLMKKAA